MFTQCPECKKPRNITVTQLREQRAMVYCPDCGIQFDALELLNEGASLEEHPPQQQTVPKNTAKRNSIRLIDYNPDIEESYGPLPWEQQPRQPGSKFWPYGFICALLLLLSQGYYFNQQQLLQNPKIRPWLEIFCAGVGCAIPPYIDINAISVLHSGLQPLSNRGFRFHAVLTNQASLAQPYPNIQLNLLDSNGNVFASRMLHPPDYLRQPLNTARISADETVEIVFSIANPSQPVAGYSFDLSEL